MCSSVLGILFQWADLAEGKGWGGGGGGGGGGGKKKACEFKRVQGTRTSAKHDKKRKKALTSDRTAF